MEQESKKTSLAGKILRYVVPLVISVGLCYVLFTGIDFQAMMDIIRNQCNFWWIALAMVIAVLSHVFRAFRWGIQLEALGIHAPVKALVYSIFGTYAVNLVFPRLGEVWRTGYVAQRQDAPFSTVFGSMVADRLADTVTVLLLTFVTFLLARPTIVSFLNENGDSYAAIARVLESPWLWAAAVAAVALLWLLLAVKTSNKAIRKFQEFMKGLWEGFAVIVRMPGKGRWLLLTVGVWGCYFLQMYAAFYAFPFTADVVEHYGALAALVTFVLSSIAMGVPSNGGIGPWQWAVMFALGIYGIGRTESSAFANLVLGCNTLLIIILGIFTFVAIALDKKKIKKTT
ncbi:MAG: flippase-like domain-containing protein [Muribaculaceae bacterium]|nr:flippase-like domain-containing protein [Muribaculaceae bacterium]